MTTTFRLIAALLLAVSALGQASFGPSFGPTVPMTATAFAQTNVMGATNAAQLARMNALPRYVATLAALALENPDTGAQAMMVTDTNVGGIFIPMAGGSYALTSGIVVTNPAGSVWVRQAALGSGPINAKWCGATGDGTTSEKVALKTAFLWAVARGVPCYIPPGTYTLTYADRDTASAAMFLSAAYSGLIVKGAGIGKTIITTSGGGANDYSLIACGVSSGSAPTSIEFSDLTIDCDGENRTDAGSGNTSYGITTSSTPTNPNDLTSFTARNVGVTDVVTGGFAIYNYDTVTFIGINAGPWLENLNTTAQSAIYYSSVGDVRVTDSLFHNIEDEGAVYAASGRSLLFANNVVSNCFRGVSIRHSNSVVSGNTFIGGAYDSDVTAPVGYSDSGGAHANHVVANNIFTGIRHRYFIVGSGVSGVRIYGNVASSGATLASTAQSFVTPRNDCSDWVVENNRITMLTSTVMTSVIGLTELTSTRTFIWRNNWVNACDVFIQLSETQTGSVRLEGNNVVLDSTFQTPIRNYISQATTSPYVVYDGILEWTQSTTYSVANMTYFGRKGPMAGKLTATGNTQAQRGTTVTPYWWQRVSASATNIWSESFYTNATTYLPDTNIAAITIGVGPDFTGRALLSVSANITGGTAGDKVYCLPVDYNYPGSMTSLGSCTFTVSGNLATVDSPAAHGLTTGDTIATTVTGHTNSSTSGTGAWSFQYPIITVVDADTYTYYTPAGDVGPVSAAVTVASNTRPYTQTPAEVTLDGSGEGTLTARWSINVAHANRVMALFKSDDVNAFTISGVTYTLERIGDARTAFSAADVE